jgi:ABC-type antimicrobial peptide transport system permease subunit
LAPATAGTAVLDDPRFRAVMLTVFGGCALLLAASGLFALTSLDVSRRRPEMAIRVTLGATRAALHRDVTVASIKPVLLGGAFGVVGAYWLGQVLQSFLYQTNARDPVTMALALFVLVSSCAAAAWLPGRKAARVDPIVTLRAQ